MMNFVPSVLFYCYGSSLNIVLSKQVLFLIHVTLDVLSILIYLFFKNMYARYLKI